MSTLGRYNLLSPYLVLLDEAIANNKYDKLLNSSEVNPEIIRDAYKGLVCCTADLLYNSDHTSNSVISRLDRFVCYICKQSISVVLCTFKTAYDLMISCISLKVTLSYVDFKDQLLMCGNSEADVDAFLAPINKLLSRVLRHHTTFTGRVWRSDVTEEVRILAQYFGYLLKTNIKNVDLEEDALSSYLRTEQHYPDCDWLNSVEAEKLKHIIHRNLKNFKYNGDLARHGSGAVAEKGIKGKYSKYNAIKTDVSLLYPYKGTFNDIVPKCTHSDVVRQSRLVFVPKTSTKLRSISMEPAALQFVQQGVMRSLYRFFKKEPTLKLNIKLEDQQQNRSLAYDGSVTDFFSTLDLSMASDLVSWALVKYLFQGTTLYPWILSTRSKTTMVPNGTCVHLKKFAPMGSALCFPIETLIFNAIAELAITEMKAFGYGIDPSLNFHSTYGDDIIVPYFAYDLTRVLLQFFGFLINENKSYHNSPFKESCGINCFCGVDITPLKYKRSSLSKDRAKYYISGIDACNQAYERDLSIFRCHLIHELKKDFLVPFTSERGCTGAVYSTHATNFHLPHKWQSSLQREIVRYDGLKTKVDQSYDKSDLDNIIYLEWLRAHKKTCAISKKERKRHFDSIMYQSRLTNGGQLDSGGSRFVFDQQQPTNEVGYLKTQLLISRSWHKGIDSVVGTEADIAVLSGRPI